MPVIEVKLYDKRVTEESVPKMIEALTNALHESSGAAVEHIQVIIEGVSPKHWGIAGKQQEHEKPRRHAARPCKVRTWLSTLDSRRRSR